MVIIFTIIQYLVQAVVDVTDKFLITKRKIEPVSYTFYTVLTGALLIIIWPWVYFALPAKFIFLNLLSGAWFALAMFVFFKALAEGEVSRVVPFVFGIIPIFDILIGLVTGRNVLTIQEVAAMFLLIPGVLLLVYKKKNFLGKHVALKILASFLFSSYYALWQYGAQVGSVLNNLMWNRIGAAGAVLLLLPFAFYRKKIFKTRHIKDKADTSLLFIFKQILGGSNFIFLSYLFVVGTISVINALQGFRYLFLFIFSVVLSKKYKNILDEDIQGNILKIKIFAMCLIFIGTLVLFIK